MNSFSYQSLLSQAQPIDGWRTAYSAGWMGITPDIPPPQDPSGWRVAISVHSDDLERAWNALADIFVKYRLSVRVATPHAAKILSHPLSSQSGAFITILSDYRSNTSRNDQAWWAEIIGTIEGVLENNMIRPGRICFSNRPIPGSLYLSTRCDRGPLGPQNPVIDYNPFSRPGPFWSLRFKNTQTLTPPPDILMSAILGPSGGEWDTQTDGAWIIGPQSDLVALKRSFRHFNFPCRLEVWGNLIAFRADAQAFSGLIRNWHDVRECVDVWRVAAALGLKNVKITQRSADERPPCIILPTLSAEQQFSLLARLGNGGLELCRYGQGELVVPVPGRLAADAFLASSSDNDDQDRLDILPEDLIDRPDNYPLIQRGNQARMLISRARLSEMSAVAAASARIRSKLTHTTKKPKTVDRLKKLGIQTVEMRQGLDRIMKPREREVNAIVIEDPRDLMRDIASILGEISNTPNLQLNATVNASARGASQGLEKLYNRPDLTMQRAFKAVQQSESIVGQTLYDLGDSKDEGTITLNKRLKEVHERIHSRIQAGPPKVKLALTPEEAAKLKKQIQKE